MLAGVLLYFGIGDRADAMWLSTFWVFMVVLSMVQAWRGGRALKSLLSFMHPWVRVISSEGAPEQWERAEKIATGTAIRIDEGERIPLDCEVVSGRRLEVDESVHTGESASLSKFPGDALRAGSLVLKGSANARVIRPWSESEWQGLRQVVEKARRPPAYLSARITVWTRRLSVFALLMGAWVSWQGESILLGVAVALAFLPNELPAILTLFTSMAASRMARARVLVRDLSSVEELGRLTLLAFDKTGTLTQHRLEWKVTEPAAGTALDELLECLWHSGASDPGRDPLDLALQRGILARGRPAEPRREADLIRDYPMERRDRVVSYAWRGDPHRIDYFCKGAPEDVLARCGKEDGEALERAIAHASQGLRVIGVASADSRQLVADPRELSWHYRGLVAFEDPLRPEAPELVGRLRNMGVSIRLLTGDHPETARAVARALGFGPGDEVLWRITPQEKQAWVDRWITQSERVGMAGDGVNDAPALRTAHVGIAMAREGTDVAREAASVLLLDDDLFDLGSALELARGLSHQLHCVLHFLLAAHIPLVVFTLLPVMDPPAGEGALVAHWLEPAQIAFLHLAIEPVAALAFPLQSMRQRPPSRLRWRRAVGWGVAATLLEIVLLLALPGLKSDGTGAGRIEVLAVLLAGTLGLLAVFQSRIAGRFWTAAGSVAALWTLLLAWPEARRLLAGDPDCAFSLSVWGAPILGAAAGVAARSLRVQWGRVRRHQKLDASPAEKAI